MIVDIKIEGIWLTVEGEYIEEESETNYPEQFMISRISSNQEDLSDLLDWVSKQKDYLQSIEELVLEKIKE